MNTRNRLSECKLKVLLSLDRRPSGFTIRDLEAQLNTVPRTTLYRTLHGLQEDRLIVETQPATSDQIMNRIEAMLRETAPQQKAQLNHYRLSERGKKAVTVVRILLKLVNARKMAASASDAHSAMTIVYGLAREPALSQEA